MVVKYLCFCKGVANDKPIRNVLLAIPVHLKTDNCGPETFNTSGEATRCDHHVFDPNSQFHQTLTADFDIAPCGNDWPLYVSRILILN